MLNEDIMKRFADLDQLLKDGYITDDEYSTQSEILNRVLLQRALKALPDTLTESVLMEPEGKRWKATATLSEASDYRDGLGGPHA